MKTMIIFLLATAIYVDPSKQCWKVNMDSAKPVKCPKDMTNVKPIRFIP